MRRAEMEAWGSLFKQIADSGRVKTSNKNKKKENVNDGSKKKHV